MGKKSILLLVVLVAAATYSTVFQGKTIVFVKGVPQEVDKELADHLAKTKLFKIETPVPAADTGGDEPQVSVGGVVIEGEELSCEPGSGELIVPTPPAFADALAVETAEPTPAKGKGKK